MYVEIGLLLNALILGTMTSFMVVTSPAVFKTLDEEHSKKFLRFIFPRLFNFCFLISSFMFLFFALASIWVTFEFTAYLRYTFPAPHIINMFFNIFE